MPSELNYAFGLPRRLGIAYRDKGSYDAAIKEFNHAKECNPKYILARLHLGITYYSQGFYGLAEEEWREALVIDPDHGAIRTYLNFVKPQNSRAEPLRWTFSKYRALPLIFSPAPG